MEFIDDCVKHFDQNDMSFITLSDLIRCLLHLKIDERKHFCFLSSHLVSVIVRSDHVHVEHGECSVEVAADHLLAVAGHDTLTWREVFRSKDRRGDDQRNIW